MDYKQRAEIIKSLRHNPITPREKSELLEIQDELKSTLEGLKKLIANKPVKDKVFLGDFSHDIFCLRSYMASLKDSIKSFDRMYLLERDYLLHVLEIRDQFKGE